MMSCPAVPRSVATMARPQASFSWAGSYRPWGPGTVPKREWGGVSAIFDRPHSVVDVGMLGAGTPSARCWEGSAARPGTGAAKFFGAVSAWDRLDGGVTSG